MIEELLLVNCQSHKDTLIKFHPGLNVLVGDTDSGKSAIIRGLDKVVYNSMPSKELISHWGGPLTISLKVDGNTLILKNDGKDSYQLNDTTFSAIGSKVPEEISKMLNMSDINIQNQIDSYFLLTETSGFVASYLNQIANLSQIDSTTKSIKSELNETKRIIEHDKKSLSDKENTLVSYAFLNEFEIAIKEASLLEEEKETTEFSIEVLDSNLIKLLTIDERLKKIQNLINLKSVIKLALSITGKIKETEERLIKLKAFEDSLHTLETELTKVHKLSHLSPLINSAIKLQKKESVLTVKLDTLDAFAYKLSDVDIKLKTAIANRTQELEIYNYELQKLDKCFFCGAELKKSV